MIQVVLIHGQGRSPLAMSLLGWRLRQHHPVHYFGYYCLWQTVEEITERFIEMIRTEIKDHPYVIISHSLGGVISRASFPHLEENLPKHIVMLAPPNQPAQMAKRAIKRPIYHFFTKDCGRKLADENFYKSLPRPPIPTTIIAGTRGPRGKFSPFKEELNDSVLTVSETRLNYGERLIQVPATHAFIMNSKQVARITLEIIDNEAAKQTP